MTADGRGVVPGPPSADVAALPGPVARMRARLLQSALSRDIDDLENPLGWNELPPLFTRGQPADFDPVAFLKARSFDGRGLEMLDVLRAVLTAPHARVARGGTAIYRWPVFPVAPERAPTPAEQLHPWRCVRFADLLSRAPDGGPPIHRAGISEGGTWLFFWTEPFPS